MTSFASACAKSWAVLAAGKRLGWSRNCKGAWDRKRVNGKVEGRKSHTEKQPEAVAMAKRLHRARAIELQKISKMLAEAGRLNERDQPFNPKNVRSMIRGARVRP